MHTASLANCRHATPSNVPRVLSGAQRRQRRAVVRRRINAANMTTGAAAMHRVHSPRWRNPRRLPMNPRLMSGPSRQDPPSRRAHRHDRAREHSAAPAKVAVQPPSLKTEPDRSPESLACASSRPGVTQSFATADFAATVAPATAVSAWKTARHLRVIINLLLERGGRVLGQRGD